ncbi:unnamed protein product [Closterium sp. NIES-65]|nr:unnamed protein product [Closterium sp. NIES-65]
MTSTSPNNAAATALRSLLDFGNSLLSELLRFRANLPRDFLRSITLPAPPPLSTSTQLNPTQIPSPSPDLPFPLWDFEYLRAPDDRERELRDRQDEWSAERAWWTAHGEQLVGFVLLLAAVLKLYRALRQTIEGLRRGLFLGSSLEGVVGGDEGDEMQSLLLQVLHTHALLLLLLHHLFPNQSRERLLIAAYRHWCRTSGPGSGEALGEILTRDFDDLCQMCRTTGAGSGEPEAYKGTAGGKKLGSKAHDGSSSASSDTDVFLWSPFPRECFDIEKLGLVSGLDSGWDVALGSGLGSEGSGLGIGGAETAAFLSLPCVIAPTDTHSLEQLFSRFAPPPDVTWMAIQSLLRKQAAAIDSSPASSSTFNLAPSVVSSSHSSSVHASTFSSFPPTQAPSQAGAAGAAAAHTPHDPLSAVAAVTASLPSTSSLILLLFFHPSSLCADLPFMHELVRRRLLALPPSSPSSSSAPPAAAAATAGGGWSLWKQRAPPQQQQGGSRGDDGGGGGAGGAGVVAAVGAGRSVDDPAAGGAGAGAAAGAAAVGGLTWVVPIFLGFSLDLSIAWQHFPAARSALTLHLSPTSILHVAQVLVQVLPGVQQAVGRAMGRLKQQGASGWEEELWGGKHVGGGVARVLRSAREILSLIRHTAALLRWLLQHRASLTLHLSLPIILTTHRLARSAQLHAQSCARVAAAAGLSSPGWSEASQVAAEVAAGFLLPEVTEAATCLSAIIARREDSWHCLRQAACARLDGLARLFVGGQGVEGGERGAADGADRGGVETGSRGGDRRGVGDGGEGMAGMGWKDGADGSIGEWFQRLSWQVSHWQHPDAPSTPASLQQLSLALADAASLHHIQSHPLAGQSLHATCRLLQDMALVQAIRSDHLAALSAAAEPGFLWALLPSLLPWLQARVRLQPECLGQVGCLLVLMRSGVAGASVGTAGSSSADSGGTGKHVHARASAASAGAGGVGGGGEFRARAGRTIAAGAATDVAGTAAAAGAGAGGRGEYLERHLRCVSRAVIAVVPASVLNLMHACTLALLPPPSHALATHSLNTDSTAGEGVASTQGRQGGLGEVAEGQGGESKAQVAARVHGQAVFRQAMGRARAAVAGFSAGVAAFEAKGLPFIGREGGARRSVTAAPAAAAAVAAAHAGTAGMADGATAVVASTSSGSAPSNRPPDSTTAVGTSRNSSSTGASSTGGMKSRDEWAAGACHAVVVALRLMLRRHAASILHTGFSEALKALHGAGLRQRGGEGKADGGKGSGWAGLWSWGGKGGGVDGEGGEGKGAEEEGGGGGERRRREGFERRVAQMERELGAWEYCTCLFEDVLVTSTSGSERWSGSRLAAARVGGGRGGDSGGGSESVFSPSSPSLLWHTAVQPLLLQALQQARGETERKGTSGYRSHPSTSANGGTFLEAALSSLLVLSHPSHAMFLPPLAAWFLPSGLPSLSLPLILRLASCLSATGRIPSTPPSNPPAAATGTTHTASAPSHAALAGGVASLTGEGAAGAGEEGPGVARTAEGLVALDWALRRAEEERLRRAVQVVSAMEKERRRVLLWLVEELREGGVQRCEQGEEVGGGEQRHVRKAKVAGSGGGGGRGEAEVAASVGRAAKSAVSMGRHVLAAYGRAEHGIAQPMAQGEACDAGVGGHGSISTAGRGRVGGAGKDGALKAGAAAGEPGAGAGRVAATAPSSAKRGPGENMGDFAGTVTGVVRALAEAGQVRLVRGLVRMAACAATGCETPAAARSVECLLASLHPHGVAPAHTAAAATAVTSSLSPDTAAASTSTTSTSSCSNDCVLTVQLLVLVSLSHLRLLLLDPSLACLSRRTRSANAFDASCLAAGICCLLSTLPNPREKIVLYEGCMEDYGNAEVAVGGLGSGLEESEVHWVLSGLSFSSAVRGTELATRSLPAVPQLAAPRGLGVTALFSSRKAAVPAKSIPATNLRTEDGIFGTSGGFGFTKANELFVGRVAMLGFAASLLGEAITGAGILSQLNIETGIPITETEPLLLFFIAFTVLGAIGGLGDRGRFVDDEPAGPPVKPGSIKAALGLSEDGPLFGFTKANELFVGRLAQLGFAASLIGEVITGRGALAQLNIEIGVPVWELEPLLLASIAFFFVAAINPGTGKFINDDE